MTGFVVLGVTIFGAIAIGSITQNAHNSSITPSPPATQQSQQVQTTPPPSQPVAPPTPSPAPPPPTKYIEESKPSAGYNPKLTRSEIYYCLAEEQRIEGMRAVLDNSEEPQLAVFNSRIEDWNSRCSRYQYRKIDYAAAQEQVQAFQAALRAQGVSSLPPKPVQPAKIVEDTPPAVTEHKHSRSQVYYCLAESARLDAARNLIDRTSQQHINWFNYRINDFNSRCSNYRYNAPDKEAAESQLAKSRKAIQA